MNTKGFTLIELIMQMLVISMIFMVVTAAAVFLFSYDSEGKASERVEQTKNDLQKDLTRTLQWSQNIEIIDDDPAQIVADGVEYKLEYGRITKNNVPLTPASIAITDFSVIDRTHSNNFPYKSLDFTIKMESRHIEKVTDNFDIVVSQRKTRVE